MSYFSTYVHIFEDLLHSTSRLMQNSRSPPPSGVRFHVIFFLRDFRDTVHRVRPSRATLRHWPPMLNPMTFKMPFMETISGGCGGYGTAHYFRRTLWCEVVRLFGHAGEDIFEKTEKKHWFPDFTILKNATKIYNPIWILGDRFLVPRTVHFFNHPKIQHWRFTTPQNPHATKPQIS